MLKREFGCQSIEIQHSDDFFIQLMNTFLKKSCQDIVMFAKKKIRFCEFLLLCNEMIQSQYMLLFKTTNGLIRIRMELCIV